MRTIGVVTVARSDYGIYLPVLHQIQNDPGLTLRLIVSGMHLSAEFGLTAQEIEEDGFEIAEKVEMLLSSDTPEGIAKSIGVGVIGFSQVYARYCPDILLVLGDRFEMHAAVVASLPFNIPVAHIHGGELTEGAIDEVIRHSITKFSHLHFVATEDYARRVKQMGEESWRVVVSGAPALDNLHQISMLSCKEIETKYGFRPEDPFLLVTFHPVTIEYQQTEMHVRELLAALEKVDMQIVFTYPNADTFGRRIIQMIQEFSNTHQNVRNLVNLGTQSYMSVMKYASAMVGNSSSGIIEAASFGLPVVNIGSRQGGRIRAKNVIDVGYSRNEIERGIRGALSSDFKESLTDLVNPYGDGRSAGRIVRTLKETSIGEMLVRKRFQDLDSVTCSEVITPDSSIKVPLD